MLKEDTFELIKRPTLWILNVWQYNTLWYEKILNVHQTKMRFPHGRAAAKIISALGTDFRANIRLIITCGTKSLFLIKYHFIQMSTQMFPSQRGFPGNPSRKRISITVWHLTWTCQCLNLYYRLCLLVYGLFLILILKCELLECRTLILLFNVIYQILQIFVEWINPRKIEADIWRL